MNVIYDCNVPKIRIIEELKQEIKELNIEPTLAIVTCSTDEASKIYVRNKMRVCTECGIKVKHYDLNPESITEEELRNLLFNCNKHFTSTILQLPLDEKFKHCEDSLIDIIEPEHDCDGLTTINQGRHLNKDNRAIIPATALACYEAVKYMTTRPFLHVVIVNRSKLLGKACQILFTNNDYTCTLCHSKTRFLRTFTGQADIVISGIGSPDFFDKTYFLPNTYICDCGITRVGNKIKRDVDIEVSENCHLANNIGVLTCVMIAKNVLKCWELQNFKNKND